VLVLGVAYKENVNDTRNAPARLIIEGLRQLGATVGYHDPLVPTLTVGEHRFVSQPCDAAGYDCAVLVTAHPEMLDRIDPAEFPAVLDTRHVLRPEGSVEWL
jgi:UDP-N-acetyl-D-glucosamine dehydrogenase